MGNFNRDNNGRGGFRGGFGRGGRPGGRRSFDRGGRGDREMFTAFCSNCGKECKLPFKPTGSKPVYCSECFEKMGNRSERRSFDKPRFEDRKPQNDGLRTQIETLNTKLDKIISLLETKKAEESVVVSEPVEEVVAEEVKEEAPKVKKSSKKSSK